MQTLSSESDCSSDGGLSSGENSLSEDEDENARNTGAKEINLMLSSEDEEEEDEPMNEDDLKFLDDQTFKDSSHAQLAQHQSNQDDIHILKELVLIIS